MSLLEAGQLAFPFSHLWTLPVDDSAQGGLGLTPHPTPRCPCLPLIIPALPPLAPDFPGHLVCAPLASLESSAVRC